MTSPLNIDTTSGRFTFGSNVGGAGGTLGGTNVLQQSIDTLTTSVNNLASRIGSLSFGAPAGQAQTMPGGGGPTRTFPGVINPFNTNPNQPGIGGGGPGGAGNVSPPRPFGAGGRITSAGAFLGAFSGYGQQQMPAQIGLNAYATQTAMAQGQLSSNFTSQYRQAFGYQGQNLNFMASSPLDAIAGTQGLQYLAGNPTFMGTPMGRAGFGYAAAFANANPLASMQASVGFAQQMANPQTSLLMMSMGYPVTPRTLGRGGANLPGAVVQGMLRAWYGQKDVNPSTLTAGLGLGGRANLNLTALGINPQQAAPLFSEYNDLFRAGLSPAQAQRLINESKSGNLATAKAAQAQLSSFGVKTATSSAQAMRNNQAVLTGRDANIASGFSRGLQDATGLLSQFNNALSNIMTTLHLNGLVGYGGGFLGTLSGTNNGNAMLGIGGGLGLGLGAARLLGGMGGGLGALSGVGGALGGLGGSISGAAGGAVGAAGPLALAALPAALGALLGVYLNGKGGTPPPAIQRAIDKGIINNRSPFGHTYAAGGFSPDTVPAMLSPGEAVLNPGAANALGTWNIHNLNNKYRPPGAGTSYNNGVLMAAAGTAPVWPFANKSPSQFRRTDQGWDLQYPGTTPTSIFAVESGTLRTAGPDPNGFGISYPLLQLDRPVGGARFIYYGHTMPDKSKVGQHVARGAEIGHTGGAHSGGNAYSDPNWLEIGFWNGGPIGNGAAMKKFLLGAGVGGGSPVVTGGGNSPGPANSGVGGSSDGAMGSMGGISGIGFSESSLIPNVSEIASLSGGGISGGGIAEATASGSASSSGGTTTSSGGGNFGGVSGQGGSRAQNKALMRKLAAVYGWGSGAEWNSLNTLEMHEAGWDNTAQNPNSTAYGIGQFLDTTWATVGGHKTSDPRLQEIYMLKYIKERYGDPNKAWAQYYKHPGGVGWYSGGGTINTDMSIVGENGPELLVGGKGQRVINNDQMRGLMGRPINMNFHKESIVIRVDHAGNDASTSGREIAHQFLKWLEDENMYDAIGSGNKNG